ncbi:hypothetical protein BDF21DRAFT_397698 [Thamnidium elegans]|nr:hypothetical protein BDF21DRAFT_397698 [Thamnidium elegans]
MANECNVSEVILKSLTAKPERYNPALSILYQYKKDHEDHLPFDIKRLNLLKIFSIHYDLCQRSFSIEPIHVYQHLVDLQGFYLTIIQSYIPLIFKFLEVKHSIKHFKLSLISLRQWFAGKAALIDPGRRDLLYCIHEDSTAKKKKYHYTRNQKSKELKSTKFRKLRQRFKSTSIQG